MTNVNKVLCVSSCGGHFKQILDITSRIDYKQKVFVVNDEVNANGTFKLIRITHAERNISQFINIYEAFKTLISERPKLILSTGASPAVIFCIVGKFFRIPTIYVESFSRVNSLSLTGKIMLYIADEFVVQWPNLQKVHPRTQYLGNLL
jgi:UDP-N-acetylglucosamine:LPS N-acetylglucosamine transferase